MPKIIFGDKMYKREFGLKYFEFKKNADNGVKPAAIYLFEGEDAFFRERGLEVLKNKYLSEPSLNFACFNGEDGESGDFSASLLAYPFMSEKRITAIREFYPKKDNKEIAAFLTNPFDCGILAILNEKSCDFLKKYPSVTVVDCGKADSALLMRWIKAECANNGVSIESEAAAAVAEYCLFEMTRISVETEKLIAYAQNDKKITIDDVITLVPRDNEYKIYELTDYIGKKKFDRAISVITDMTSKGETPQRILVSVYNYFRRLLLSAISGKTAEELSSAFNIKEYAATKTLQQSKMFGKRSLKRAVDALADSDYKIKCGLIDADEQMWLTVFGIMTDAL